MNNMEQGYTAFGKLFAEIRKARGISQEALAENLLTQRAISNLEKKGELPNPLVFDRLMRRLGISTQFFMTMLTQREYDYLCWKEEFLRKIEDGSIQKEDLDSEMAQSRQIHEALQGQFQEFWKGYALGNMDMMERAIARTVTGYPAPLLATQCLSSEEIMYMLLSIEKYLSSSPIHWENVRETLSSIIHYIETNISEEEQIKVYAKAVCIYGEYILDADKEETLARYRNALELHRRQAVVTDMCQIMHGLLREAKLLQKEELEEYKNELHALEWVKNKFHIKEPSFMHWELHQEYCLLNEVLESYRRERGLQLQDIARHVCSAKTYRALASGKRDAKKKTYLSLADYMGIPIGVYNTEIITDSYEDLKLVEQIRHFLHRQRDESALLKLSELKKSLGDKAAIKQNAQFISSIEDIMLFEAGDISLEEYKMRVESAIRLTIPDWDINYGVHFYTQRELTLVYYEAKVYRKMKKYDTAIRLLSTLWDQLEQSKVSVLHRGNEALLINTLWKDLLSDVKEYEKALEKVKIGIELSFATGRGAFLDVYIFEPGWITNASKETLTEHERKDCLEHFKNTFYISKLFGRRRSQKILRNYCDREGFDLFS